MRKIIILLILSFLILPARSEIQDKKQVSILHGEKQFSDLSLQYCFNSLNKCQDNLYYLFNKNNQKSETPDYYTKKIGYLTDVLFLTVKKFPESETSNFKNKLQNESDIKLKNEITDLLLKLKKTDNINSR